MSIRQDIGPVSAYALAKEKGYQGTEEDFEQAMANVGTNIGEIREAIDTFNDVTVPTATQAVTDEGIEQVGLVNAAGTAQVEAVEEKGTIEIGAVEAAGTAQISAVNSAGSTQVGNVNTAGSIQVSAVNGAGTTQVGNVNTAGGTQVAAVQAKGDEVIASIPEDYSELTQEVSDLNAANGDLKVYTFNRISGIGQYWNNWIENVNIKAGTKIKAILKSYGGTHLRFVKVHLHNGTDWVGDEYVLEPHGEVGGETEFIAAGNASKIRFQFYSSEDDGAISASVFFMSNNAYGVSSELLSLEAQTDENIDDISALESIVTNNASGSKWRELVEIDNLSGVWFNPNNYGKNGDGITGYVTKIFDVANIYKARFSGNAYNVLGEKADGTKVNIVFAMPATNAEFDVSDYEKIYIGATQDKFWGGWSSNYIKLEGFQKSESKWKNSKIVWFGTSISAGGFKGEDNPLSYPFQVGRLLGATVYNEAVGDSGVHYRELSRVTATNPYGFNFYFVSASRCLTNTIAMMQWLGNWADYYCNGGTYKNDEEWDATIFTSGLPSTWSDADTEAIKQFSYENKLDKYLTDGTFPDLFVFDHGYNDRIRWSDNTGTYEAQLAEYGRDNCYTFRGAMNFLIDRIYSFNPQAKIIMIGDYENQSDEKKYDSTYQMRVAEDYEIPIYERWKYTGWSQVQETAHYDWSSGLLTHYANSTKTKKLVEWAMADGVHPHSDKSGGAIRMMARLIAPFIEKLK